jgi:hypothetical protein
LFLIAILALQANGQTADAVKTTAANRFSLSKDSSREFTVQLKKGDYVDLDWEETSHEGQKREGSIQTRLTETIGKQPILERDQRSRRS